MVIKLPSRRTGITEAAEHLVIGRPPQKLLITVNLDRNGKIMEVFCANPMRGEDMDALMTDGCILISLALQAGVSIERIVATLGEIRPEGAQSGPPASPIGTIARQVLKIDRELGEPQPKGTI